MKASYQLVEPDFTPAPGWEHRITATPEIALGHATNIYSLASQEFEQAVRSRHPLLTHRETIQSNETITDLLQLQSQMAAFIANGRWHPDWVRIPRKHLREHVGEQIRIPLETIHALPLPLPFNMCISTWMDHAIQPVGSQSVSYHTAREDWRNLAEQFREEPEYPSSFRGIYLGFDPPTLPDTRPPKGDYDHAWHDVTYDPGLGYRAARHILRINHAGRAFIRDQHGLA